MKGLNSFSKSITLFCAIAALYGVWGCDPGLEQAKECHRIGDYSRAKRLFEAEIDRRPLSFEARYGYAIVLEELGLQKKGLGQDKVEDWLEVVAAYEICAKVGESQDLTQNYAIALFHLANRLYLEKRYGESLVHLMRARSMEPKNKFVLNLCGIVQYSQGAYREAQETFEYLLAIDPGFISGYLNLGNVLWESGQEDAALVTWKQALSLSPGNQTVIKRIESALQKITGS